MPEAEYLGRRAFVYRLVAVGFSATGLQLSGSCGLLPALAPVKMPRIGVLFGIARSASAEPSIRALVDGLRDYGYTEDHNIQIELRFATQAGTDLPAYAAELVALQVDLIIANGTQPTQAAQQATSTVPIVGVFVADPVATGIVQSLGRPGGNITAISNFSPVLAGKRLELLQQIVPGLTRVALVLDVTNAGNMANLTELQKAAVTMGMVAVPIGLRSLDDIEPGVEGAVRDGVGAVMTTTPGRIPAADAYARLAEVALRLHLPSMGFERRVAEAGGLMSEGPNMLALYRRAGYYVDRILKGAWPGDLPVEQPREIELVVNQTTAHALGLTIPPDVALQVTDWIQ